MSVHQQVIKEVAKIAPVDSKQRSCLKEIEPGEILIEERVSQLKRLFVNHEDSVIMEFLGEIKQGQSAA